MTGSKKKAPAKKKPDVQIDRGENAGQDTQAKESTPAYEPKHLELENAGFDHHGAERQRQTELQRERDVHNARTGDASRA
jgi:hypothetical protein